MATKYPWRFAPTKYLSPATRPNLGPAIAPPSPPSHAFKPYTPPPPPSGSYDPALDAQRAAANRGYGDIQQDVATGDLRAGVDYGLAGEELTRGLTRATEDHDRQVALLTQSYQRLQRTQAERSRAAGVTSGGLALAAAARRAANQAQDQAPIDQALGRATEDTGVARGNLLLGYQRGGEDRSTALQRAGRENSFFGLDIGAQEAFQAAQSGYIPPGRGEPGGMPRNEHVDPRTGQHFQTRREGGYMVYYDEHGNVISRRRLSGAKASLIGSTRAGVGGLGSGIVTGRAGL